MADPNTSSRWLWKYETVPGVTEIDAVDDVTYEFGEYDDQVQQWAAQAIENGISPYWKYSSRTPTAVSTLRAFPTFKHMYNPTTVNFLVDILGNVTDAAPDTIVACTPAQTQYPKTVRYEEGSEGTNDKLVQAIGCYTVSVFVSHSLGKNMLVDQEFAFQSIEDQGDQSLLTTDPTAAGGETLNPYVTPIVTYDHGGGGEEILDLISKVEYRISQNINPGRAAAGTTQTIYKTTYELIDIILYGIIPSNVVWNQYFDRTVKDYEVKHLKPNGTDYVACQFNNCRVGKVSKTATKFQGWSNITIPLKAEDVDVTFNFEGSNFTTHYLGVVV